MKKYKMFLVFGTRPEAVKMAPLVNMLKKDDIFETIVCVSAQHRQMLDQVLQTFQIKPDYDLNIMKDNQTLTDIIVRTMKGMDEALAREKPDMVLVHGDTTTTFAGALAAFYRQIPVGHIEAGLRTHQKYAPYPEEMNRRLTGALTDIHFAPTALSKRNLEEENIHDNIYVTGNTVIDAFLSVIKKDYRFSDEILDRLDFKNRRAVLLTCHRRDNLGERMKNIFCARKDVAMQYEDVQIIFPVHLNPQVRNMANEVFGGNGRVLMIEPMAYEAFANLIQKCYLVLTDSGGMQEEAPAAGKPVLVLRDTTERPEAVEAGTALLAGTGYDGICTHLRLLLNSPETYDTMAKAANPYGDGRACQRIIMGVQKYFGIFDGEVPQFNDKAPGESYVRERTAKRLYTDLLQRW